MIVNMSPRASEDDVNRVVKTIRENDYFPHVFKTGMNVVIGAAGPSLNHSNFESLISAPGVAAVNTKTAPFLLASREFKPVSTLVQVGDCTIGGPTAVIIAGPCVVESREQIQAAAKAVKKAGASILRGGAFKSVTSPYDFQGLGALAIDLLVEAREATGLPIVTEITSPKLVDLVASKADMLQIGAGNMQNYSLLKSAANSGKPILLKRGHSASINDWLLAAEYVLAAGNPNVVLCEQGIKTFNYETAHVLDLAAVARVRELSHLPIIVDPSHSTGKRSLVPAASRAALAAGANGLMIEIRPDLSTAFFDDGRSLDASDFIELTASFALPPWHVRIAEPVNGMPDDMQLGFGNLSQSGLVIENHDFESGDLV